MSASRLRGLLFATAACVLLYLVGVEAQFWPQWALNAQHTGQVNTVAQATNAILTSVTYDPLAPAEIAATGELGVHYQVPLIDDNRVFMEFKAGTYNKNRYSTQTWGENGFQWQNGQLVQTWSFTSDWTAPGSQGDFWEPVFHGVLTNGTIYVPGAGGTLFRLDKTNGAIIARINPVGAQIDPTIIVAGVPTADNRGNIYFNVIQQFNGGNGIGFYQHDIVDSWLVKVAPDDSVSKASYSTLTTATAVGSDPSP